MDYTYPRNCNDMKREVIGRGTWIDKIASTIINREKEIGRPLKSGFS